MNTFLEILPIIVGLAILVFGTILLSRYIQLEKDMDVIKKLAPRKEIVPHLPKPNLDFIIFGIALIIFAVSLIVMGFCSFIFNNMVIIKIAFPAVLGGLVLVMLILMIARQFYNKKK